MVGEVEEMGGAMVRYFRCGGSIIGLPLPDIFPVAKLIEIEEEIGGEMVRYRGSDGFPGRDAYEVILTDFPEAGPSEPELPCRLCVVERAEQAVAEALGYTGIKQAASPFRRAMRIALVDETDGCDWKDCGGHEE